MYDGSVTIICKFQTRIDFFQSTYMRGAQIDLGWHVSVVVNPKLCVGYEPA